MRAPFPRIRDGIKAAAGNVKTSKELNAYEDTLTGQEASIKSISSKGFKGTANNPFNQPARDNYVTYPYDYFSGADAKIFFGDIWVDDIATIQYTVSQNKTPIYGYASQHYQSIARGQIIVEGTLAVPFKEVGYLNLIQATLEAQRRDSLAVLNTKIETNRQMAAHRMAEFEPGLNYFGDDKKSKPINVTYSPTGTPQIIRQEQTIENILLGKKAGRGVARQLQVGEKSRDFEDFAELLEDSIWGDSNGRPLSNDIRNELKRADEFDYSSNGGIQISRDDSYANVLNIMLAFGDINDFRAEHTLVVLNDVHFLNQSMIVSPTGEPIAEVYNFIARDINKAISNELKQSINPIKLNVGNDALKVSRVEDVATIEEYLNKFDNDLILMIEASLSPESGWGQARGEINGTFEPNNSEPFVDQLIRNVERLFNELSPEIANLVDTGNTQYILTALGAGTGGSDITMVLDQQVPETRTYKVISPTRQGFAAKSIITREDLFSDISELEAPLDVVKNNIETRRNEIDERFDQAQAEKEELRDETIEVGREDEANKLNKAQARLDRLQEVPEDQRSNFRKNQIRRAQKKVDELQDEYDSAARYTLGAKDDAGLQEEARKLANREQKAAEIEDRYGDGLLSTIANARERRARNKLLEEQSKDIEDRDFNIDEAEAYRDYNARVEANEENLDDIYDDRARMSDIQLDYNDSIYKKKQQEEEARIEAQKAAKEAAEKIRQEEAKRKALQEERDKLEAEKKAEYEKEQEKLRKKIKQSLQQQQNDSAFAPDATSVDIGPLRTTIPNERTTTVPKGLAITNTGREHHIRSLQGLESGEYGLKRGELVGSDLADNTKDYVPSPYDGTIVDVRESSYIVRTPRGYRTIAHVNPYTYQKGQKIKRGDPIYYLPGENHIHIQARDISAYSLDKEIMEATGAGYRNTYPTEQPSNYTNKDDGGVFENSKEFISNAWNNTVNFFTGR